VAATASPPPPSPAVSVCVPAYHGAAHIAATIESVLAQTYADFELVVVDDGSTDGTAAVVERYADPRIRLVRNPRRLGAQGNWNRCLELARGRYFKLLPQDDLLAPPCLARQVAALEGAGGERLALVFCARTIIDADGRALMTRGYPGRGGAIPGRSVVRRCLRRGTNLVGEPGGVLLPLELARRAGAFDGSLGYVIDLDYWCRLLLHGDAFYQPETLASFRVSGGSWSVAIGWQQSRQVRSFVARIAADPAYGASRLDAAAGWLMAALNSVLRLFVYRLVRLEQKAPAS
jgi:glycosyltransferase involved in cell wall biosynthesis